MPEKETKTDSSEIQLVIFRLKDEEFGLEISQVKEIIRMQDITPMPKAPNFIEGVINLRGQIIAVMDLAKRFGVELGERTDKARIIVVEVEEHTIGIVVDEVPEVLRLSEGSVEPTPRVIESQIHADYIKGVGKMEDRIIILLATEKILNAEELKNIKTESE